MDYSMWSQSPTQPSDVHFHFIYIYTHTYCQVHTLADGNIINGRLINYYNCLFMGEKHTGIHINGE